MKPEYRKKPYRKKPRYKKKAIYGVVVNEKASNYSAAGVDALITKLARSKNNWHVIKSNSKKEVIYQVKKLLSRQPEGIIACGGDGTVNLVARNLIRRTCTLGILPMGKFNNIYKSLYGQPDMDKAMNLLFSPQVEKIDYGLAGGFFFLGSIGIGLLPEMMEIITQKKVPRFSIGWSRRTSEAAASVRPIKTSISIDEFKFDIAPVFINLNLLSYSIGLPISPTSINNDGKAEIIFDIGSGQAILSGFIRKIYKGKYIYSDDIRMFRGSKISISSIMGRKLYIDGEIIKFPEASLSVETFQNKIRVYQRNEG